MATIQDIRSDVWKVAPSKTKRTLDRITTIVRHHSGGNSGDFFSFWSYWKSKGWSKGGYAEIILRDGTVQLCYDPEYPTNGVANQNTHTYHICLVGNGNFTEAQEKAWTERCLYNMERLKVPNRNVKGHKEMPGASTACPGINMHVVRNRLLNAAQKPPVVKGASEEMLKPSIGVLNNAIEQKLNEQVKEGLFEKKWLDDYKKGQLTVSDYLGLQAIAEKRKTK